MPTIILADDHQVLRDALRMLLESQPDFHVLAETGNGLEAARLTERMRPDILVLDMLMPGVSGLEVTREVKRVSPESKVIILSMYDSEGYVVDALGAGASGYVLKKSSSQELIFGIRQVLIGKIFLSPPLNERAIDAYIQRAKESRTEEPYETLTRREREVFQLVIEGLSNSQIAEQMSLSDRTVEMHRGNFMKKLGLRTQMDLIKYAVKKGMA